MYIDDRAKKALYKFIEKDGNDSESSVGIDDEFMCTVKLDGRFGKISLWDLQTQGEYGMKQIQNVMKSHIQSTKNQVEWQTKQAGWPIKAND